MKNRAYASSWVYPQISVLCCSNVYFKLTLDKLDNVVERIAALIKQEEFGSIKEE